MQLPNLEAIRQLLPEKVAGKSCFQRIIFELCALNPGNLFALFRDPCNSTCVVKNETLSLLRNRK